MSFPVGVGKKKPAIRSCRDDDILAITHQKITPPTRKVAFPNFRDVLFVDAAAVRFI